MICLARTRVQKALFTLPLGFVLAVLMLAGAGGSSASTSTGDPCPPLDWGKARQFCVTVTDTDGVSKSPDQTVSNPGPLNFM